MIVITDIIGHRGANEAGYKPQSQPAYLYATSYAQVLEGDLRWTKDNVIVIHHDANLKGTYTGKVSSYKWAQIRDKHTNADGSKVITLGALLGVAQSKNMKVSLEFKINPTNDQIKKVKSELDKYNLRSKTRLFSFDIDVVNKIQKVGGLSTGINSKTPVSIAVAKDAGNCVAIDIANLTPAWLKKYKDNKILVQTYTLNKDAEDRQAIGLGMTNFDGYITDRPSKTRYFMTTLTV